MSGKTTTVVQRTLQEKLELQKVLLSKVWADPKNREYAYLSLGAGLISSIALDRLYRRLQGIPEIRKTESEIMDPVLMTVLIGFISGSGALIYKINKAHKVNKLV